MPVPCSVMSNKVRIKGPMPVAPQEQWVEAEPVPPLCKYFNSHGGCRHGDRCYFVHQYYQPPPVNNRKGRRNDLNNNSNNNSGTPPNQKGKIIKVNEIACGECGKVSKSGDGQTAKQTLKQHYMDKLAACDDKHIRYFLEEADFHIKDLICFACGRRFEEVQDLLHHFFRQVKTKGKKKFRHQEQLARIARPFVERDWNNTVEKKPDQSPSDEVKNKFTMQLLKSMVKPNELNGTDRAGDMMRSLARWAKISESSGGGANGEGDEDDDDLDEELEEELDQRAKNFGFTDEEYSELMAHGIKPWEDEVDAWEFLEELHSNKAPE